MTEQQRKARAKELLDRLGPRQQQPAPVHQGFGADTFTPDTLCGALFMPGHDVDAPLWVHNGRLVNSPRYPDKPVTCPDCLAIMVLMQDA